MKKIIAVVLSVAMVILSLPLNGFATDELDINEKNISPTLTTLNADLPANKALLPAGSTLLPAFSPEITEYDLVINTPIRTGFIGGGLNIKVNTDYPGAKISASYKNVNTGAPMNVQPKNDVIKLPGIINADKVKNTHNIVSITVTPSDGDQAKPVTYTLNVKLKDDSRLMGLEYKSTTASGSRKLLNFGNVMPTQMNKFSYDVDVEKNDSDIKFDFFLCDNNKEITVNGGNALIGTFFPNPKMPATYKIQTPEYNLEYGKNIFKIKVTDKTSLSEFTEYTITVNRAEPELKCEFEIEGGGIVRNSLISEGENTTIKGYTYAADNDNDNFNLKAVAEDGLVVTYDIPAIKANKGKYEKKIIDEDGVNFERPTYERNGEDDYYGRKKMSPKLLTIYVTNPNNDKYTKYNLQVFARMPNGAGVKESNIMPGQFANGYGKFADETLMADINTDNVYNIQSLGTFGGSTTYEFKEPIRNDPNNKYGVDFVVYGNAFGTNKEPGAVSVSEDGNKWYTLAGSEHYELSTVWDYSVTYNRGEDSGISTTLDSFTTSNKAEDRLKFRKDMFWPFAEYHDILGAKTDKESVTVNGVCTYDGLGMMPEHAFGYVDASPNGEVNPEDITVTNPYKKDAKFMDLSWAVDANGKPVNLDSVKYVRVTNCVLYFTEAFGEVSTEVGGITEVNSSKQKNAVGVTKTPKSIKINGKEYTEKDFTISKDGIQHYIEIDTANKDATNIEVDVEGVKNDSIWINNLSFTGCGKAKVLYNEHGERTFRVIVQNAEKEPVIYVFNVKGGGNPFAESELKSVELMPGKDRITSDEIKDNTVIFDVEENVEKISLKAETLSGVEKMSISGDSLEVPILLNQSEATKTLAVSKGKNTFKLTITSVDGTKTKDYIIIVNRKENVNYDDKINVSFKLIGDTLHGKDENDNPKPGHKEEYWLKNDDVFIPEKSTAKYLIELMLFNADIEMKNADGNYISSIKSPQNGDWLGEFDNGKNSGWMYSVNGKKPNMGIRDYNLEDGDSVILFYTDDYTKLDGTDSWGPGGEEKPPVDPDKPEPPVIDPDPEQGGGEEKPPVVDPDTGNKPEDKPSDKPADKPAAKPDTDKKPVSPQTGDENEMLLLGIALLASAGAFTGLARKKKTIK